MNFCHTRNQAKYPILFHSPQQVFGIFESWEMEMSLLPVLAIFSSSSTLLSYLKQTCPSSCPCGLEGAGRGMQKGASPVQPPWLPPLPLVAQGKCKGQMQNQGEKEWQTGGHISLPSQKEKKYKGRGVCGREGSHLCQLPVLHPGPQSSHKVVLGFHLPCNSTFKRVHSVVTPLSSLIMLSPWDFSHAVSFLLYCSSPPSSHSSKLSLNLVHSGRPSLANSPQSILGPAVTSSHGALCVPFLYLITCPMSVLRPQPTTSIRAELCLLSHCLIHCCWLVKLRGYCSTILE